MILLLAVFSFVLIHSLLRINTSLISLIVVVRGTRTISSAFLLISRAIVLRLDLIILSTLRLVPIGIYLKSLFLTIFIEDPFQD